MNKMVFQKADTASVDEFIKQIQSEFPSYTVTIDNVNDFSLMLEERRNCQSCNGLSCCQNKQVGHETKYDGKHFYSMECRYKKEESLKRNSLIKTLYIPDALLSAKIEDYYTDSDSRKKIYSHMMNFVGNFGQEEFSKGLYLYSTFSKGKTYTLAVIASELAKKNIGCLLIYFPDLVLELKNSIGSPRFEQLINMLKSIDVLMLDDLGAENMTSWVRDDVLGPIINYRVLSKKPIYVSSNIKPSDLISHLSMDKDPANKLKAERIVNRMQSLLSSLSMEDSDTHKR